jgi:transcriptional regulator
MHPNPLFRWDNDDEILDFIAQTAFARIFAMTERGPRVAHVPVLVESSTSILFHLANGNALTAKLSGQTALILVEGPNAYLSANWYADITGAVPSWNYIAAEAEGVVTRLDRAALIGIVDGLAARLEPRVGENWTRAKMDPARFEALLGAIKPFRLEISALRGTRKASQNKPEAEAARLMAGMRKTGGEAMAAAMETLRT